MTLFTRTNQQPYVEKNTAFLLVHGSGTLFGNEFRGEKFHPAERDHNPWYLGLLPPPPPPPPVCTTNYYHM